VLRKNVVEKVLKLLRRRERWLVVAGVRFLRTCIGTRDDFYMRYLVRRPAGWGRRAGLHLCCCCVLVRVLRLPCLCVSLQSRPTAAASRA
jgi:hypothetical protein